MNSILVLGILSWAGSVMFNYLRSRITLKKKPDFEIALIKRNAGRDKPYPILQVILQNQTRSSGPKSICLIGRLPRLAKTMLIYLQSHLSIGR